MHQAGPSGQVTYQAFVVHGACNDAQRSLGQL